jgi:alpha-L-arabinofuranosidase
LPLEISGLADEKSLFANAVKDDASGEIILKVVNPGSEAAAAELNFAGLSSGLSGRSITLTGDKNEAMNTMKNPQAVAPVESALAPDAPKFTQNFPPRSFTVLRLKSR